jgi:peptidyl-tRNA hydrolase, PTH1 family
MSLTIIAGLGNPGPDYLWTRHNAGFMVLDRLSASTGIPVTQRKFSSFCGEGNWTGKRLLLLKPQTFMNVSGRAVAEALRFHKATPAHLVVVHDDLDIPFGQVKLKPGGGHGGHNGLRSIAAELGTGDFLRVRVGIGRPPRGDSVSYVLGKFSQEEAGSLADVLDGGVDLLELLLREGAPKAMSIFNSRNFLAT